MRSRAAARPPKCRPRLTANRPVRFVGECARSCQQRPHKPRRLGQPSFRIPPRRGCAQAASAASRSSAALRSCPALQLGRGGSAPALSPCATSVCERGSRSRQSGDGPARQKSAVGVFGFFCARPSLATRTAERRGSKPVGAVVGAHASVLDCGCHAPHGTELSSQIAYDLWGRPIGQQHDE
jgi:hypothetical protein